ncbi:MAG: FG-GAP-like repeat-containing protein [Nitrospirota bacterium]|nr:FG-GAP-like repeat-containing protein [Nitrospirota bacterium]
MAGLISGIFATLSAAQEIVPPPPALSLAVGTYKDIPIQFGFHPVGADPTVNPELVQVTNIGSRSLTITSITSTNPVFSINNPDLAPIEAGQSAGFQILFEPTAEGQETGYIEFSSNDAFNPVYRMPVQGVGINVQIAISPPGAITVPGEAVQFTAAVTGTPNTSLIWTLTGIGQVNSSGRFQAGMNTGTALLTATSLVDPTKKATVQVSVVNPDIALPPDSLTGAAHFGTRIVTADLDQDGFIEVIAAAPTADVTTPAGTVTAAGQVWIREFGWEGFVDPPVLLSSPFPVTDGHFGMALKVGDFDGDGNADLMVGEPNGTVTTAGSGAVHLFSTLADGSIDPVARKSTGAPGGVPGDRFGAVISSAYFSGNPSPYVAVGAPGTTVAGIPMAGAVHLVDFTGNGAPLFPLGTPITQPSPQAGASFGESLAGTCLDDCTRYPTLPDPSQKNDLVIGAPGAAAGTGATALQGAGRVFLLRADTTAPTPAFLPAEELFNPFPAAGARFGHSISVHDFSLDIQDDLAIGAPGQPVPVQGVPVTAGAVYLYLNDAVGNLHFTTHLLPDAPTEGLRFGASLVAGQLDGDPVPDLAVGTANTTGNGSVTAWLGNGNGFSRLRNVPASGQTPGDGYGIGLAVGDLNRDGVQDLVVGAPYASVAGVPNAGDVYGILYKSLPDIGIDKDTATVARTGVTGHQILFRGSIPSSNMVWDVLGPGTINQTGLYTAPAVITDPILSAPMVRLRDSAQPGYWALARVHTVKQTSVLTSPDLIFDFGKLRLGYPETGANFGTSLTAGLLGRSNPADPDPDKLTVLAGYPTLNSEVPARFNAYPFFSDPVNPFGSINPYLHLHTDPYGSVSLQRDEFGRLIDAGSSWGMQMASGDFNGDGFADVAVSAPFAPLAGSGEPQAGYVDIWFLGADGGILRTIRFTPEVMVAPDASPLWTANNLIANTRYGFRLLVADLDGNGMDDLVVAAPYADVRGIVDAGLVEILLAPATGDWVANRPLRTTLTETTPRARAYFGSALAIGDTTGNGIPELFFGAPGRDPRGTATDIPAVGAVTGIEPLSWAASTESQLRNAALQAPRLRLEDPQTSPPGHPSGFGMAVAIGNMHSDDPADELVIGAPYRAYPDPVWWDQYKGEAFKRPVGEVLVYDPTPAFTAPAPVRLGPAGRQVGMQFGQRLAIGNFSPGVTTLVVGTPFSDGRSGTDSGAVFFYRSQASGAPRFDGKLIPHDAAAQSQFGFSLLTADLDRNGIDELLIGAPTADVGVLIGYNVYPGRFGSIEEIIDTRKKTGKVYVIFPDQQ